MPWAFWKRQAFSVGAAKKSWESPGSEAAWATQKELPGSATTKRHWRPVGVRCWHRSGVKSELGDFCVILILASGSLKLEVGGLIPHTPGCFGKRVRKALKTKDGRSEKSSKRVQECASDWRERR